MNFKVWAGEAGPGCGYAVHPKGDFGLLGLVTLQLVPEAYGAMRTEFFHKWSSG